MRRMGEARPSERAVPGSCKLPWHRPRRAYLRPGACATSNLIAYKIKLDLVVALARTPGWAGAQGPHDIKMDTVPYQI